MGESRRGCPTPSMPGNLQESDMIFSDRTIRQAIDDGRIEIDPYEESFVQPSSVDLRCDNAFRVFENHKYPHIDPRSVQDDLTSEVVVPPDEAFILHPGEFVL